MADHLRARRRPAALAALACVIGLSVAHSLHPPALLLSLALIPLLGAAAFSPRGRSLLLLGAVSTAAGLRYQSCTELLPPNHISRAREFGCKVRVTGTLHGDPLVLPERIRFVLELSGLCVGARCRTVCGRILVTASRWGPEALGADCGDELVLIGRLGRPQEVRNPGAFDYRAYLSRHGIDATLRLTRPDQVVAWRARPGPAWNDHLVRPVRQAVRREIRSYLQGTSAALLEGMLLGDRNRIPAETQNLFRLTGLAHALVISGLHVGLLGAFLYGSLTLCGCPARAATAATLAMLGAYALITGLQAPVIRAVIMATVFLGGRLLERRADVYNGLGIAALVILGLWPRTLFGLSFQLSFGATLAILGLNAPVQLLFPCSWRRAGSRLHAYVTTPLSVSLAAQLGTAPLLACHFHRIALLAPLANLLVVPLLAAALALGVLSVALGLLWIPASLPFVACNSLVLAAMLSVVRAFAGLSAVSLVVPAPGGAAMIWSAVALILIGCVSSRPRARWLLLMWTLAGADVAVWTHLLRPAALEVTFLDVGQGDAAVLRFPGGRTMLVDGGRRSPYVDYGARVLLPFLHSQGIRRLDVVVATHQDADHIGGLLTVLERMPVGWYVDSGQHGDTHLALRLRRLVQERGIVYRAVSAGDSIAGLGGGGALVLHPRPAWIDPHGPAPQGMNNTSVVLRVTWRGAALLFTGDVENGADPDLLAWGDRLQAQVLKVAHHGACTSTSRALVGAVHPQVAVISVGAGNRFGHPCRAVLQVLERQGIRILRTDRRGAVVARAGRHGFVITTMLPGPYRRAGQRARFPLAPGLRKESSSTSNRPRKEL